MYLKFTYQMQMVWLSLFLLFHICSLQNEYHMHLQRITLGLCPSCFSENHHGWSREKNSAGISISQAVSLYCTKPNVRFRIRQVTKHGHYLTKGVVRAAANWGMDVLFKNFKSKSTPTGKWEKNTKRTQLWWLNSYLLTLQVPGIP